MKRRAFLTALLGIAAAPAVAELPVPSIGVDKESALGSTSGVGIFRGELGRFEGVRIIESGLAGHNHVLPTRIDGEDCYTALMHPDTVHQLRCIEARERWKDKHRAQRIAARENELRRTVAGGIDVQEMRRLARADLKAQGVAWA